MSVYRLLSLFWLIPGYLVFLSFQQAAVHFGAEKTFKEGVPYPAEVVDMQIKHIAAQSNAYVVLKFTTPEDGEIVRKHGLTIQMSQKVHQNKIIPISYRKNGYPEIVLVPTYEIQYSTSLFNMWVAIISSIVTILAGIKIQKFSNKRSKLGVEKLNYEIIDSTDG